MVGPLTLCRIAKPLERVYIQGSPATTSRHLASLLLLLRHVPYSYIVSFQPFKLRDTERQALVGEQVFSLSGEQPAYTNKLEHITVHTAPRDSVTGPAHAGGSYSGDGADARPRAPSNSI